MRVGVIGCGLIGAAVARELRLRGVETVVYEARGPGAGTSGTTFAWVNSHNKEPTAYHELNVAGMQAHHALHAQRGQGVQWFFPTGNLVWTEGAAGEDRAARLEEWGYPVRRLTLREARELEPDLLLSDQVDGVLFFPSEGYVLPAPLLARLLGEALDLGAELRCPALVEAIVPGAGGVVLQLADGSTDRVDVVVSCVGRWTEGLLGGAGYSVPLADPAAPGSATVGFLAYTRPLALRLGRVLTSPRLHVRPDGGGRLVLQGLDLDVSADPALPVALDGHIAREFAARLGSVLRGGQGVEIDAVRVGQRSLPIDGLTVTGHVDAENRVYVIATHSGVTLALALAGLAAREIVGDARAELLGPFRPQRFAI